ncbi:MAG TPA: hypothetical protein VMX55_04845 [candidate division Zixibacteria bacterium]|nr:hypothetical protein [candidate division Zixibacteria bacterium]
MAKNTEIEKSSASLNGETDLEGKVIIDSRGEKIGVCKVVKIGEDGQIGLSFTVEINGKQVVPSQTIPYSVIGKITDVIELKVPINIKVAQSADELKTKTEIDQEQIIEIEESKDEEIKAVEEIIIEKDEKIATKEITDKKQEMPSQEIDKTEIIDQKIPDKISEKVNVELPVPAEKLAGKIETHQADATAQLSKTLPDDQKTPTQLFPSMSIQELKKLKVSDLIIGLEESMKRVEVLFTIISEGNAESKIEALKALTNLTRISPELGLSLLQKMMKLNDEKQQDVRLVVAEQMEIIGDNKPELFKGYFLELLENAFEEPIEEIREQILKTLHNTAMKVPEIALEGLEEFLEEVLIGKRVPEVPNKLLHDATLKVISGNFQLTRVAIKARLKFIAKGDKLGTRCAEELEDYNATLIGLTIIESFSPIEAEKLVNSSAFKKLETIFVKVINQMIEAYKEGSFRLLTEVVDKKIEIPIAVIERFYEIKVTKTLEGAQNIPMEVFLENAMVEPEEAEQIIYRLVMQKRINAAITMNNGRTFITALEVEGISEKPITEKPKITVKKSAPKSTSTKKTAATTTTKKTPSSTTKKPSTTAAKKSNTSTTKKGSTSKSVKTSTKSKVT